MNPEIYRLYGALGSPYSMKMRALLRYRRIPHLWLAKATSDEMAGLFAQVKAPVIPLLVFPNGSVRNDSTPLALELEKIVTARSVLPPSPAAAFLVMLLEDMADEWGTKIMFHYRWARERDQRQVSRWLLFDRLAGQGETVIETAAEAFRARQVGRMALVGCTPQNAPVIEASAEMILEVLEAMATNEQYLFGSRPSLADFAWYGQLSQLASDPTPADLMRVRAPYLIRWLTQTDDASGAEGEWKATPRPGPSAMALLKLAADLYLPFLQANSVALSAHQDSFAVQLLGQTYVQAPFRYQGRCLEVLHHAFADLDADARAALRDLMEETGLSRFFPASPDGTNDPSAAR